MYMGVNSQHILNKAHKGDKWSLFVVGCYFKSVGDIDQMIHYLTKSIDHGCGDAAFVLGSYYTNISDYDRAKLVYIEGAKLNNYDCIIALYKHYKERNHKHACLFYLNWGKQINSARTSFHLGNFYKYIHKYDQMVESYEHGHNDSMCLLELGHYYQTKQENTKALMYYGQAISLCMEMAIHSFDHVVSKISTNKMIHEPLFCSMIMIHVKAIHNPYVSSIISKYMMKHKYYHNGIIFCNLCMNNGDTYDGLGTLGILTHYNSINVKHIEKHIIHDVNKFNNPMLWYKYGEYLYHNGFCDKAIPLLHRALNSRMKEAGELLVEYYQTKDEKTYMDFLNEYKIMDVGKGSYYIAKYLYDNHKYKEMKPYIKSSGTSNAKMVLLVAEYYALMSNPKKAVKCLFKYFHEEIVVQTQINNDDFAVVMMLFRICISDVEFYASVFRELSMTMAYPSWSNVRKSQILVELAIYYKMYVKSDINALDCLHKALYYDPTNETCRDALNYFSLI